MQKFWLVYVTLATQEHPVGQGHLSGQRHPARQGHLAEQWHPARRASTVRSVWQDDIFACRATSDLGVLGAFGGKAASIGFGHFGHIRRQVFRIFAEVLACPCSAGSARAFGKAGAFGRAQTSGRGVGQDDALGRWAGWHSESVVFGTFGAGRHWTRPLWVHSAVRRHQIEPLQSHSAAA